MSNPPTSSAREWIEKRVRELEEANERTHVDSFLYNHDPEKIALYEYLDTFCPPTE